MKIMLISPMMSISDALILYEQRRAALLERHRSLTRPVCVFLSDTMDGKWGVGKTPEPSLRKVLVVGSGRCGTTYLSSLLCALGLDIPHLRVGRDGVVSHYFMVDADWYTASIYGPYDMAHIGERASDYVFKNVVHLVRHPLPTIRSLPVWMSKTDLLFLEESGVVPEGLFWSRQSDYWNGMVIYYYTNLYIQSRFPDAFLLRLESVKEQWEDLLDFLSIPYADMPDVPPQNQFGTPVFSDEEILVRKHFKEDLFLRNLGKPLPPVTAQGLMQIDAELGSAILSMGKGFGYEYE